jgi:hypothetical protein
VRKSNSFLPNDNFGRLETLMEAVHQITIVLQFFNRSKMASTNTIVF